jgi:hypothetical protein
MLLDNSTDDLLFDDNNDMIQQLTRNESVFVDPSTHKSITEINLDNSTSPEVVQELLQYIYTGKVSLEKMTDKLILAAHKYEFPELKKMCEKSLYPKIKMENAIQMYSIGHEVGSHKIVRRAFAIMKA